MSDSQALKRQLRKILRDRRNAASHAERDAASGLIARKLAPLLSDMEVLGAFASHDNEVDLTGFYEEWLRDRRLAFPRVVADGFMVFSEVRSLDELEPGAFGILEPPGPPLHIEAIDAFLVPAVAFDRGGRRLGFGGGYYDRLLGPLHERQQRISILIGIGYSWQLLDDDLPSDPWDVRMGRIVTDAEIWSPII